MAHNVTQRCVPAFKMFQNKEEIQRFSYDMHHMKIKKKDKNLVRTYIAWEEVLQM